jgi:hypothetical protein
MTVYQSFPGIVLDPKKQYWYGRVAEGQEPPKGKVIKRNKDRLYVVEKEITHKRRIVYEDC